MAVTYRYMNHKWTALFACAISAQVLAASFDPVELKGTWRVENNAEIIAVDEHEARYFDATSVSCIQTDRTPVAGLAQRFARGVTSRHANSLTLADRTGYPYWLTRMDRLPLRCNNGGTTGADPVLNFEAFIAYFKENYAGDAARHLDWQKIHSKFKRRVTSATSADELWEIYSEILHGFDDVHVFLSNGKQGKDEKSISAGRPSGLRKALLFQDSTLTEDAGFSRDAEVAPSLNNVILYDVLHGKFSTRLEGKFQWGWAGPGVAYLSVRQMSGLFAVPATDPKMVDSAVRDAMRAVLSDFKDAGALIIDVRQNRGGSGAVGYAIASFFADRTVTVRSRTRTPNGFTDWLSTPIPPDVSTHFAKRVYVLVSDNTVSAGEEFAGVMREYPNVTLVGTTTRGALSDILVKKLPDGSILGLADVQVLSPSGKAYETVGIAPDVRVESYRPECLLTCFKDPASVALKLAEEDKGAH